MKYLKLVRIAFKEKRDRWHESLAKDIYVEEALNLDDLQTKVILKSPSKIKKRKSS
jgi:carboxyl-terminal processing protease